MSAVAVKHVRFPGNWEALYVQGERVAQGHSIDVGDVFNHIEGHEVVDAASEYNDVSLTEEFQAEAPKEYSALPPV
jgi:hypothetical protein